MSQSVSGLKNANVGGLRNDEGPQPASNTGELGGKKVTAGDVFKTIGRVVLGVVTLGISEAVIRLVQRAQRKPPEVVPTTGPGRATQTLEGTSAPPKGKGGSGAASTDGPAARSSGRASASPGTGAAETEDPAKAEASRRAKQKSDLLAALGPTRWGSYLMGAKAAMQNSVRAGTIPYEMFHTLSDAEQVALYAYTQHECYKMNGALRGAVEMGPAQQALCGALDSALAKLPPFEGPVHRGADLGPDDQTKYAAGQAVAEPCYTSTSKSTARAFAGNTQWAMESKTGRDISFISAKPHEQEILFPRDARFEVLDNQQVGRGMRVVMKEVS